MTISQLQKDAEAISQDLDRFLEENDADLPREVLKYLVGLNDDLYDLQRNLEDAS